MIYFRGKDNIEIERLVTFLTTPMLILLAIYFFKSGYDKLGILIIIAIYAIIITYKEHAFRGLDLQNRLAETSLAFVELVLIVLRSEGQLNERNIKRLEKYFSEDYDSKTVAQIVAYAKKNLKKTYNYKKPCNELYRLPNSAKIRIIHKLFLFSADDGIISEEQKKIILKIAKELGLSTMHYRNIEKMFDRKNAKQGHDKKTEQKSNYRSQYNQQYKRKAHAANRISSAYKILGLPPTISNQLLKSTFRQLAKQYHPDKWAGKTPAQRKRAKETFQELSNAYEIIKKSRNMK